MGVPYLKTKHVYALQLPAAFPCAVEIMRKTVDDAVANVIRGTVKIDVHIDYARATDVAAEDVSDYNQR